MWSRVILFNYCTIPNRESGYLGFSIPELGSVKLFSGIKDYAFGMLEKLKDLWSSRNLKLYACGMTYIMCNY